MKNKELVKKKFKPNRKNIVISMRINSNMQKFMRKHKYSPALIFLDALNKLGFEEKGKSI